MNEVGTVLINGIISQVHADIILGKTHICEQASHFLSVPTPGPGHLTMEEKGESEGLFKRAKQKK